MFILLALFSLLATSSFAAFTWTYFIDAPAWPWQAAALGTVASFVGTIFLSFRRQHVVLGVLGTATAVLVGFLNFALVAAIACWLVLGVATWAEQSFEPASIARVLFGLAGLATAYGLVNGSWLRTIRHTICLPNLPEAWRGREVALVSDIHVGNIRGVRFVRRIVKRLEQLQPAAVLIAGDMFDGAKVDIDRSVEPWGRWAAPAGTFFVLGNHDEFNDPAPYLAALKRVGVWPLDGEKVTVDGLQIVGVHDAAAHRPAQYRGMLHRAGIDRTSPSILIMHQPANLAIARDAGISLQVSGHTHSGQFWPWSLVVRRIYGRFAYGHSRLDELQVVTSSGAGSWGPPMRVGTRAEIVMLRLECAAK